MWYALFFADHRVLSWSYVAFWVSPKWSHSFPGCNRSPLGLAPTAIGTPSVDVMGHARQASSTYARFDRLDIASGGRQRPSHFHPMVNTHPHTHTQLHYSVSLVVTACVRRRDWCPSAEERSDVRTRAQCRGQGAEISTRRSAAEQRR